MIKLSKMTDYAVIILAEMVSAEGRLMSASDIAALTSLPEPTVSKVLKLLAKKELVTSVRGIKGGYSLSKEAEHINMALVVEATDGPIKVVDCVDYDEECCERSTLCSIKGQWNPLNRAVIGALQSVSLAQMMEQKF